jgi:CheY-like chemotaxis protein
VPLTEANTPVPKVKAVLKMMAKTATGASFITAWTNHMHASNTCSTRTGASDSIDAVHREVALPVDDVLADAAWLLERYVGHAPDVAQRLRFILHNARLIKQRIMKVGEEIGPRPLPSAIREPPPPDLKGIRVLVADNDDSVRRSAHALIGRWGGIVETARDGQEALTMARLARYDAIVADVRLPDLSGYEVYRALREAQPSARVILMTGYGYDSGHSLVRARQEGLRHVLFKPFRVDQPAAELERTARRVVLVLHPHLGAAPFRQQWPGVLRRAGKALVHQRQRSFQFRQREHRGSPNGGTDRHRGDRPGRGPLLRWDAAAVRRA